MAKHFDYYDQWKESILECPLCGWKGTFEQGSVEYYHELMDSSCPKCDCQEARILAIVNYPAVPGSEPTTSRLSSQANELAAIIKPSLKYPMKSKLDGWHLTEGRIGPAVTESPKVSEIIAALEAILAGTESPFVILQAPEIGGEFPNYCQVLADDAGYVCEIRIFKGAEFSHSRGFLRDTSGGLGEDHDPHLPDLSQVIGIVIGFIADPTSLPSADPVEWLDVTEEF